MKPTNKRKPIQYFRRTTTEKERRHVAEDFRGACIAMIRGSETGLSTIFDATRASLNNLETQVGSSLYQPEQLTAGDRTNEWGTLHRFYSGRVR